MPILSTLRTKDLQHVRKYSDAELTRVIGVTWSDIARVLGYAHISTFTRKLNKYKEGDQYLPIHISCLIEAGLWRLGKMKEFIALRQRQEGVDSICWKKLPNQF